MMKKLTLALTLTLLTTPLMAQTNLQLKTVVHPTVAINDHWFVAGWNITNIRENATDNTNFMLGLGRKQNGWWMEVIAQRQDDTKHEHHWFVDIRSSFQLNKKMSLYAEAAPFLDQKAVYNFMRIDIALLPWLKVGVESENVFKAKSSTGLGPCVGLGPWKLGPLKPSFVLAWQVRRNDPNFVRTYVVLPLAYGK